MQKLAANFAHQADLFDPSVARKVVVFGCGSVGSWMLYFLAKMGVADIEVYDADVVDSYNCPMSLFSREDIGRLKVEAAREKILRETGVEIKMHPHMYTGQRRLRNCSVVSCVDKMESGRVPAWRAVKLNPSVDIYLDSRIAKFFVEIYAINPSLKTDINRYESTLFSDEEAVRQTCGSHGVVFVAVHAASMIAATLARFWSTGEKRWRVQYQCDMLSQVS